MERREPDLYDAIYARFASIAASRQVASTSEIHVSEDPDISMEEEDDHGIPSNTNSVRTFELPKLNENHQV